MKRTLRVLGLLLGLLLLAVGGFAAYIVTSGIPNYSPPRPAIATIEATPKRLAQGEKLMLAACGDCHLNRETNVYSGHLLSDLTPDFGKVYTANITQDKDHGIGQWTDSEVVGLLRTGIGRDGRFRLIMPHYVQMSDEDVASIVAFLRSGSPQVKADPTPTPAQEPSFLLKTLANTVMKPSPLSNEPIIAPDSTKSVAFGRYLVVGRYKCYECHSHDFKTNNTLEPEQSEGYLGGGNQLLNQQGQTVVSRNITGDANTGIGDWSEAQFSQALHFGQSPNGPLNYPMPKYSQLTEQEVHALFAYLQSVPKIKNATPEDGAVARK